MGDTISHECPRCGSPALTVTVPAGFVRAAVFGSLRLRARSRELGERGFEEVSQVHNLDF